VEITTTFVLVKKVSMAVVELITTTSYYTISVSSISLLVDYLGITASVDSYQYKFHIKSQRTFWSNKFSPFVTAHKYSFYCKYRAYMKSLYIYIYHCRQYYSEISSVPNINYRMHLQPCMSTMKNAAAQKVVVPSDQHWRS
jgi:hypothetical protein